MSVFSFSFAEVIFLIYSLVIFSKTVILCQFSAKTFIKRYQLRDLYNHLNQKVITIWIKYLINVFAENAHSITVLEKIAKQYTNNITFAKEKENTDTIRNDKIVRLLWVPKKSGIKTIFTSRCNLKNLICTNKPKLLPNTFPGVYQLDCTCNVAYIW